MPPSDGFVVWLTGLSGAGKTTIANQLASELEAQGRVVERLDGDVVRTHLTNGLGFSKSDRDANVTRVAWVAARLARAGDAVIVSLISPYSAAREQARQMIEEHASFVEIHVCTPLNECIRRDPKGLYARALAGEIENFTGVSAPYEAPTTPALRLDTTRMTPAEAVSRILAKLHELQITCSSGRSGRK